jgi:hypothetical protein
MKRLDGASLEGYESPDECEFEEFAEFAEHAEVCSCFPPYLNNGSPVTNCIQFKGATTQLDPDSVYADGKWTFEELNKRGSRHSPMAEDDPRRKEAARHISRQQLARALYRAVNDTPLEHGQCPIFPQGLLFKSNAYHASGYIMPAGHPFSPDGLRGFCAQCPLAVPKGPFLSGSDMRCGTHGLPWDIRGVEVMRERAHTLYTSRGSFRRRKAVFRCTHADKKAVCRHDVCVGPNMPNFIYHSVGRLAYSDEDMFLEDVFAHSKQTLISAQMGWNFFEQLYDGRMTFQAYCKGVQHTYESPETDSYGGAFPHRTYEIRCPCVYLLIVFSHYYVHFTAFLRIGGSHFFLPANRFHPTMRAANPVGGVNRDLMLIYQSTVWYLTGSICTGHFQTWAKDFPSSARFVLNTSSYYMQQDIAHVLADCNRAQ